jgi:hypothetical protein
LAAAQRSALALEIRMRRVPLINLAALTLAAAVAAPAAWAHPAPDREHCFASGTWKSWTAAASGDVLYLRININDIYRVDLTRGSHVRHDAGDFLVNQVRGSNWICSALDLDLTLSNDLGVRRPLIATNMRKLTPAEVAAIPRRERP